MTDSTAPGLQSAPAAESWACTFSDPSSPSLAPGGRYRDRVPIGRGSMGLVEDAYDTLLRRHVALKVLRADAPHASRERFTTEATITAGLEHPGIVTVHDSGTLEEGLPYYTMQLVRGHPWSPQAQPHLADGLRTLAAVCEAVGHAHANGIVHRDLKPANIMVRGFATVVVVDWGLAVDLSHLPSTSSSTPAVGTPLYMSPEQARGSRPDPSADVWSLGIMLFEVLAREHPLVGLDSGRVIERVTKAELPALPEGPPELISILRRALAPTASDRYPSAVELAAELRSVLSGARVTAHEYRVRDLLKRFWQAQRARLMLVAGVALLLVGTALYAAIEIARESRQARHAQRVAQEAERQAQSLRASSEQLTGRLLAQQAQAAARADQTAAAEHLAEAALHRGEFALARGVLSSTWFQSSPVLQRELAPPCPHPQLSSRGERLACIDADGVRVFEVDPLSTPLVIPLERQATSTILEDDTGTIWIFDQARELLEFDRAGSRIRSRPIDVYDVYPHGPLLQIGNTLRVRWLRPDGSIRKAQPELDPLKLAGLAYDNEHTLVISTAGEAWLDEVPLEEVPSLLQSAVAVRGSAERRFVVARDDGRVSTLDVPSRSWSTRDPGRGRLTNISTLGDDLVALSTEQQTTLLWDAKEQRVVLELPRDWGAATARRPDGTFVSVGRSVRLWALPEIQSVASLRLDVGLSMAVVSPTNAMVAVARGDGTIQGWDTSREEVAWSTSLGSAVIKSVAFSTDGANLFAKSATAHGVAVIDPETGAIVQTLRVGAPSIAGGRRAFALADESVWSTAYGTDVYSWASPQDSGAAKRIRFGLPADASASEGATAAVLLEDKLFTVGLARADGSHAIQPLGVLYEALAVDVDDTGTQIVAGFSDRVSIMDLDLRERETWALDSPAVDVSMRGDASMVAAGLRDGTVLLWHPGQPEAVARLRVHEGRVASVDFAKNQLVSAGWDGVVRRWALEPLQTPVPDLFRARSRWGPASGIVPFIERDALREGPTHGEDVLSVTSSR